MENALSELTAERNLVEVLEAEVADRKKAVAAKEKSIEAGMARLRNFQIKKRDENREKRAAEVKLPKPYVAVSTTERVVKKMKPLAGNPWAGLIGGE